MARKDTTGIEERHAAECARRRGGRKCSCSPTFVARVNLGARGKRLAKSHPTREAAAAWRDEMLASHRRGGLDDPARVTVRDAGEALIVGMRSGAVRNRSGQTYKPSVAASYAASLEAHIYPRVGGRRLVDLRARDLQRVVEEMSGAGASPSTIRNALLPVRVICRRARALGGLAADPLLGVEMPAVRGRREHHARPVDIDPLLDALPPADRALWACFLLAGLRWGEATALRWRDIDLAAGELHVRRAWCKRSRTFTEPKSDAGSRTIAMPAALRDALLEHRAAMPGATADALAFGSRNGTPLEWRVANRRARRCWDAAGVTLPDATGRHGLTSHEARHTFASLAAAAGVPVADLSDAMGHRDLNTTWKRYRHAYPETRRAAAARLDELLASAVANDDLPSTSDD